MRLIDADKLSRKTCAFGVRKSCESCREVKKIPNITCDEIRFDFLCMIDNETTVDAVPRELYEQIQWERNVALSQLKQLNIELCEKPYLKAIPIEWFKKKMDWLLENEIYGAEVYQWVLNRWNEDKENWLTEGKENDETKTY